MSFAKPTQKRKEKLAKVVDRNNIFADQQEKKINTILKPSNKENDSESVKTKKYIGMIIGNIKLTAKI